MSLCRTFDIRRIRSNILLWLKCISDIRLVFDYKILELNYLFDLSLI